MRGILVVGLLLLAGCSSGGTDYDRFRELYEYRATYGDEFRERPPELSDEQIDAAIAQVCPDGPGGEADLKAADKIGATLAGRGEGWSPSGMGSAVFAAVRAIGACDPYDDEVKLPGE